jgi:two-component system CheB/CheR fusion protein
MQAFAYQYDESETPVNASAGVSDAGDAGDAGDALSPTVYVVDDDYFARSAVRAIVRDTTWRVEEFSACETFLDAYAPGGEACLVLDVHFPGMGGLQLMQRLRALSRQIPVIVISGSSRISEAVQSMKIGACDFLEKPLAPDDLRDSLAKVFRQLQDAKAISSMHDSALELIATLTPRQREIMRLVLAGQPSKNIAADLGISRRTVENHRASIMHRTGVKSLPALARLALSSAWRPTETMTER